MSSVWRKWNSRSRNRLGAGVGTRVRAKSRRRNRSTSRSSTGVGARGEVVVGARVEAGVPAGVRVLAGM